MRFLRVSSISSISEGLEDLKGLDIVGNDKVRILNTVNRDLGSDDINNAANTREIISRVNPDLLSQLKSVVAGAA